MILMYTAQPLSGFNQLEQGAGQLNVEGALRLAKLVKAMPEGTAVGTPMLSGPTPAPTTTINYEGNLGLPAQTSFKWSQGIMLNHAYATGQALVTSYQSIYGQGALFGDGVIITDGVLITDGVVFSDGVTLNDQLVTSSGVLLGEGSPFLGAGVIFSDGVVFSDGSLFGDGLITSDGAIFGDLVTRGDYAAQSVLVGGERR
jgi:acetyltransferase-like isoleucine patch superfamily enzyme